MLEIGKRYHIYGESVAEVAIEGLFKAMLCRGLLKVDDRRDVDPTFSVWVVSNSQMNNWPRMRLSPLRLKGLPVRHPTTINHVIASVGRHLEIRGGGDKLEEEF